MPVHSDAAQELLRWLHISNDRLDHGRQVLVGSLIAGLNSPRGSKGRRVPRFLCAAASDA